MLRTFEPYFLKTKDFSLDLSLWHYCSTHLGLEVKHRGKISEMLDQLEEQAIMNLSRFEEAT